METNFGLGEEFKFFLILIFKGLVWTRIFSENIAQNGEKREPP